MRARVLLLLLALAPGCDKPAGPANPAPPETSTSALEKISSKEDLALRQMLKRKSVTVSADRGDGTVSRGSGFVYKRFGEKVLLLTNAHVIYREEAKLLAPRVFVRPHSADSATLPAQVLFFINESEKHLDLALLVVHDAEYQLGSEVEVDATHSVRKGGYVVAVGSPLEEDFLVDHGEVVQIEQKGAVSLVYHNALVEHGSSGGGLFNRDGELIGINTYISGDGRTGVAVDFSSILQLFKVYDVRISAGPRWHATDIKVSAGDDIIVLTDGEAEYPAAVGLRRCTPEGVDGYDAYRLVAEFRYGSILGKLGKEAFSLANMSWRGFERALGKALGRHTAKEDGVLSFLINGRECHGAYDLTILVVRTSRHR